MVEIVTAILIILFACSVIWVKRLIVKMLTPAPKVEVLNDEYLFIMKPSVDDDDSDGIIEHRGVKYQFTGKFSVKKLETELTENDKKLCDIYRSGGWAYLCSIFKRM